MLISNEIDNEVKKIADVFHPYVEEELSQFLFDENTMQLRTKVTGIVNKFCVKQQYAGLIKGYSVKCNGKNNKDRGKFHLDVHIAGEHEKYTFNYRIEREAVSANLGGNRG